MKARNWKTQRQNMSEADIISNMPDSILSHILSFLPTTKDSVRTSVLSKRWTYVWTSVDKFKFDSSNLLDKARKELPRFVYKVLKLYQGNIKSFTLSGHGLKDEESDVVSWINTAVSRGVERLHFDIRFPDGTPDWPLSVFSCKTLVDLKMWSLYDFSMMDIPSTPIFPCLKKLEVWHCDDRFFRGIVSRCLALEHFIGSGDGSFHIVSSSIKRLDIHTGRIDDEKVVLCVPSLQYLKFYGEFPFEFIVEEKLSSLIEADIYLSEFKYYSGNVNAKELRNSFVRLIQPLSNVKLLRIKSSCNKFFNSVGHGLFVNLTKLEISSSFFEWRLLVSFMESSFSLEAISLKKTSTLKKHKLAWKEPKEVPTSLSSSLRKISIDGYSEEELPMVKYVLRTAQILERVDIHSADCYRDNNNWKSDMLQNLQKLHRASVRCEIFLV